LFIVSLEGMTIHLGDPARHQVDALPARYATPALAMRLSICIAFCDNFENALQRPAPDHTASLFMTDAP
jgi:hypothetical protein